MSMTMSTLDAFNLLGITSQSATQAEVKKAYRKAARQYHPDRNRAGLEMMKLINGAYEKLQTLGDPIECTAGESNQYGECINQALNAIIGLGLTIEVCGSWVWIFGDTKPHKDVLKAAGFRWSAPKCSWYFRPEGYKPRPHPMWSMDAIRHRYGSSIVKEREHGKKLLQTA